MKDLKKKKILIAVNSGMGSVVSVYFLKKQGFEVIAVSIVFNSSKKQEDIPAGSNELPYELVQYPVKNVNEIRKIYEEMGVKFLVINAQSSYYGNIFKYHLEAKLVGRIYNTPIHTTGIFFNILLEKAKELDIEQISTGHYAKVLYNKRLNQYFITTANNFKRDESYYLSILDQDVLSRLILPLADMNWGQVEKLGKNFKRSSVKKI